MGHTINSEEFNALRLKLEQASKIVISPTVSKEQRQLSENIFLDFRASKSPYEFCKYLLETSKEPYVLFQSVYTLKEAAIREWLLLTPAVFNELETFLLNYIINNYKTCDKYVQRQILQAISVLYKRRKLCNKNQAGVAVTSQNDGKLLIEIIIELFRSNDDIEIKNICFTLMFALLSEFSNTNRSSNIGLSCTSHMNAKCMFEKNEFKTMLIFVFEVLQHLIDKNLLNYNRDLIIQLLSLIETSFNWEFTSSNSILKTFIKRNDQPQTTNLKPTPDFKDIFLNASLITLLYRTYELLRKDNELAHICMQSIIQLSTMNGPIFDDPTIKAKYLEHFIQHFINLFTSGTLQDYELLNLSCLIENLLLTFSLSDYLNVNEHLVDCFFDFVITFIVNCFEAEKYYDFENRKYFDSYERVILTLTRFKEYKDAYLFKKHSKTIVDSFIKSRLRTTADSEQQQQQQQQNTALSFGINKNLNNYDNESIDEDIVEDDLQRFKDILFVIAEFARVIPEYCLPLVSKLLNEKVIYFTQIIYKIATETAARAVQNENDNQFRYLNNLYEDLHWLLLISGFILFDIDSDAASQIPKEIMIYSISISSYVNLNQMHNLFINKLNTINIGETDLAYCDPICALVYTSLQLCELEIQMQPVKMLQYMSPQVASTLTWFLKEFSKNYLFMNERDHPQLSPVLQHIFGDETECGISIINYLIRKLYSNFFIWSSENSVTTQTSKLFHTIVKNNDICKYLFKNEIFWSISKICISNEMPWLLLPSSVKKLIIKSLIISLSSSAISEYDNTVAASISLEINKPGSSLFNNNLTKITFYETILKPLSQRFDALFIIKHENIHVESVIKEVMNLIDTFNGIIEGTSNNLVKQLFPFILPRLQQSVELLNIYHNYGEIVELILCMFNGIIENYLFFLDKESSHEVYRAFLCMIEVFSKHNTGIGRRSIEANIEEDYYNDLLLFMTLLNTLQNKDLIQELFDNNQTNSNHKDTNTNNSIEVIHITSVDVVLRGLEFLIPLMNQEMLKFQALCVEYFKLISTISDSNPEKILSTPIDLYSALVNSIEYGFISGFGVEITRLCLECVVPLCNYVFTNHLQQSNYGFYLRKLFQSVFNMIFRNSIEVDLFEISANALYSMICCFQDTYNELVNGLLAQYADEQLRHTIINGFQALTPNNFQFNLERRNRLKFNDRFNQFCIQTYGLLFIK